MTITLAVLKIAMAVFIAVTNPHSAGKVLIDCEDYEFKTPCYTIDEGHERIVLNYNPYSYVNLS